MTIQQLCDAVVQAYNMVGKMAGVVAAASQAYQDALLAGTGVQAASDALGAALSAFTTSRAGLGTAMTNLRALTDPIVNN